MAGDPNQNLEQRRFALAFDKVPVAWAGERLVYDAIAAGQGTTFTALLSIGGGA